MGLGGSAELQDQWAGAVRRQAARIGPCAGMITTHGGGPAILEAVTYPDWPPEMVVQPPEYVQEIAMLGAGRDVLYRYSWVTIIPAERLVDHGAGQRCQVIVAKSGEARSDRSGAERSWQQLDAGTRV